DSNPIRQMERHETEPPRPLHEFNPAVPDELEQVVQKMLAKDPAQRYQTPAQAAQDLEAILARDAAPLPRTTVEPPVQAYLDWLQTTVEEVPAQSPAAATPLVSPPEPSGEKSAVRGQETRAQRGETDAQPGRTDAPRRRGRQGVKWAVALGLGLLLLCVV